MLIKQLGGFFLDIIEVMVFAIAIFLFVYLLVMQPHKIKGDSMHPNFPDGEYLLTDKISYRFREPSRGDVVVFEAPGTDDEEFIKRIIALPNEKISILNSEIYINGKKLNEFYIPDNVPTSAGKFLSEQKEINVPGNHYIVLGDNRPASSDSRAWGFVPKDKITGRAWIIYWPLSNLGLVETISY
jgi:signal peptidase I